MSAHSALQRPPFWKTFALAIPFSAVVALLGPLMLASFYTYNQIGLHWPNFISLSVSQYVGPCFGCSTIAILLGWWVSNAFRGFSTLHTIMISVPLAVCAYSLVFELFLLGFLNDPGDLTGWSSLGIACTLTSSALSFAFSVCVRPDLAVDLVHPTHAPEPGLRSFSDG